MTETTSVSVKASTTSSSHPIEIPAAKREAKHHLDVSKHSHGGHSHPDKTGSIKSNVSDEDHRLPDGSPSFSVIMNELGSNLSKTTIRQEIHFPISPLALSEEHLPEVFSSDEAASPGEKLSPPQTESPQTVKKRLQAGHGPQRNRSQSWNHRSKMAMEGKKHLTLTVPHHLETNSAHSSPLNARKQKKVKSQPGTPQFLHVHPKFKILTQNLSASHEDIVKEQERERHLEEGFVESKSIFDAPNFDRSGATPELE